MKRFLSVVVALLSTTLLIAQTDAKKILDGVSSKFKSYATVTADFTYKVESAAGKVVSSQSGNLVAKGNKYKLILGEQKIFCNGKATWSYDENANEVTVNDVDVSGSAFTPQKLFSNFYDKDFSYKLLGQTTIDKKLIQEVELTPKSQGKNIAKIVVGVDKANQAIYNTTVTEKNGNKYSYTITKFVPNKTAADKDFDFNKDEFPDVEVVDLRARAK